jgi:hypothetical protein
MRIIVALASVILASSATAAVVLDQYQFAWSGGPAFHVGGSSQQMLAQTFRAGRSGRLVHADLVFGCNEGSPGMFTVEVTRVDADDRPDHRVLGSVAMEAAALVRDTPAPVRVDFSGVGILSGERYALVMRADDEASCWASRGVSGTGMFAYAQGKAYYDARPNPPGWVAIAPEEDLPFWTYVRVPEPTAPRFCNFEEPGTGLPQTWLPARLPICGCLSDQQLRENRCWFALPGFTLWRTVTLPGGRPPGMVTWSVVPMDSGFPGLAIEDEHLDGTPFTQPLWFQPSLSAGKMHTRRTHFQSPAEQSRVRLLFEGPEGPIEVSFLTVFETP